MALTAATIEKAVRRLLALEQRIERGQEAISIMRQGSFQVAGKAVPLSQGQKNGITAAVSDRVAALERVLAGLEIEITGSTTIEPQPAGPGISDWESALVVLRTLQEEQSDLRQVLLNSLFQNMAIPRDEEGELMEEAAPISFCLEVANRLKERLVKIKIAVAQLRALGA